MQLLFRNIYDSTLEENQGSYLTQNDDLYQKHERINSKLANQSVDSEIRELSKIDPEDHKSLLEPGQHSEDYKLSSNTTRAQNEPNFITLGKISLNSFPLS